jgi:hypothetical protein
MIRTLLLALKFAISCGTPVSVQPGPYHNGTGCVTQADVDYFFDSISLKNGHDQFKLSRNISGMSWRISSPRGYNLHSVTDICRDKQLLTVSHSARLDIKGNDFTLSVLPSDLDLLIVRLIVQQQDQTSPATETRKSFLKADSSGRYVITAVPYLA